MLTCTFEDGDTWMFLWLLVTVITVLILVLAFHYRTLKLHQSSSK
nr:E5 DELTA [human papillomavirus 43]WAB53861.1 E5 DELTA [human papillomavirus 43]WAB54088.1 E5 DELTA [human papillomavirus 43]WAB54181.1 E5 DELTA [human papillomavirus 43]WBM83616.1 E5 DELTA protein [human papillomavirus 43]